MFPIQLIYLEFNRSYPWIFRNSCSSVNVAIQLYTWRCGAQISLVARNFLFSETSRQGSETQPASYLLDIGISSWGKAAGA